MEHLIEVGSIYKAHGVKGLMKVFIDPRFLDDLFDADAVFIKTKEHTLPYFIESIEEIADGMVLLKLEEIDGKEDVSNLIKCSLFLPKDKVSVEIVSEHSLNNYTVIDTNHGTIGKVLDELAYPSQDMLLVEYKNKEILIPLHKDLVLDIDDNTQKILFDLPDGFLDIF